MGRRALVAVVAVVAVATVTAFGLTTLTGRAPVPSPAAPAPRTTRPMPTTVDGTGPLPPNQLVMVFSGLARRGGSLFVMYGDGRIRSLDAPIRASLYPSFVTPVYGHSGPALP